MDKKTLEKYILVLKNQREKAIHVIDGINAVISLVEKDLKKTTVKPTDNDLKVIEYSRMCGFEWLAKDIDGSVYAYEKEPTRGEDCWEFYEGQLNNKIRIHTHFTCSSFDDEEPYYIGKKEKEENHD